MDADYDIQRTLQQLSRKAENCDRLLESIAHERRFHEDSPRFSPMPQSSASPDINALSHEISNLKEGQNRIMGMLEDIRNVLMLQSGSNNGNVLGANSATHHWNGATSSSAAASRTTTPFSTANTQMDQSSSDPKYKELRKKLLMANLKILELQNQQGNNSNRNSYSLQK